MRKLDKVIILFFGVCMLVGIVKENFFSEKKNEITIDGIPISREPCLAEFHKLFGNAVDSVHACDCLLTGMFGLIKNDKAKVQKFKDFAKFELADSLTDTAALVYQNCITANLLDTNYKIHLNNEYRSKFYSKLKHGFDSVNQFKEFDSHKLINCLIENLNGKITIKEYFANDYLKIDKIKNAMISCLSVSRLKTN